MWLWWRRCAVTGESDGGSMSSLAMTAGLSWQAYAVAPLFSVRRCVTRGEDRRFYAEDVSSYKCRRCATCSLPNPVSFRGVNGDLLPDVRFNPEFHAQCRFALLRRRRVPAIQDIREFLGLDDSCLGRSASPPNQSVERLRASSSLAWARSGIDYLDRFSLRSRRRNLASLNPQ